MSSPYQLCTRCVMDTSDPGITFDANGVCHYCQEAERLLPSYQFSAQEEAHNLAHMSRAIRASKGRDGYDCIIGLSGGVDSSYIALLAKQMGLKPLCVHFDNGWNTESAVSNVKTIIEHCGFDLYTYVINWEEFRDLQRSFIKAGVIDLEMLSDHAIFASMFKLRRQFGIRHVLSGTNFRTENGLPNAWIWSKMDWTNIKSIHKAFGQVPIKTFPSMTSLKWLLIRQFKLGGVFLEPLNQINYSKSAAMKALEAVGWRYYGGKHHESVITKFYQTCYLPQKFGVDKRRCHHSALIRNGEMSRDDALDDLKNPPISVPDMSADRSFVLKKLGFTDAEFEQIMRQPPTPHAHFKTDRFWMQKLVRFGKWALRK